MGEDKYVYAVARIRVKERNLLNDADIARMVALPDEKAVLEAGEQTASALKEQTEPAPEAEKHSIMQRINIFLAFMIIFSIIICL